MNNSHSGLCNHVKDSVSLQYGLLSLMLCMQIWMCGLETAFHDLSELWINYNKTSSLVLFPEIYLQANWGKEASLSGS